MNNTFKRIGLISKSSGPRLAETLQALVEFLHARGREITLDTSAAEHIPPNGLPCVERPQLAARCDLVIVVGGDGTILNAGRSLAESGVPLVGVNLGRLGFLADVSPDRMAEQLDPILAGSYDQEERALLEASVYRGDQIISTSDALNDVVIHKWDIARMIELEVRIDGRMLNTQRSDGLIVATPTGSTAYALSGGGPIMHPKLDVITLVPMFPHTLSSRPIVIDAASEIRIHIGETNQTYPHISCDGQTRAVAKPDDVLVIRRKPRRVQLVHPLGHNFYEVLRSKLGWSNRLGD